MISDLVAALRADPDTASHWIALASALVEADRLHEARALLERFLAHGFPADELRRRRAPFTAALYADARLRYAQDRLDEADQLVDLIVLMDDGDAGAIHLAGIIAGRTNRHGLSVELLAIAVSLDAGNAGYACDLGVALAGVGSDAAALAAFRTALDLDPCSDAAHINLADLHRRHGRLEDTLACLRDALRLKPESVSLRNNLGVVLQQLGRTTEALAVLRDAAGLDPTVAFVHSNLVYATLYAPHEQETAYVETARAYGLRHAAPLGRTRPFLNDRTPDRRLRIGFVSADLHDHPVARFLEPFLAEYDPARHETFAYSNGTARDAVTERLKARFGHWREIVGIDDEAVAGLIEADRIDILVDLSGHTAGHRLLVFARKPAPIEITWIGYPATTGLTSIDYRLTDSVYDPPGVTDRQHTERLWRLPGVSLCYQPYRPAPEVAERPPCARAGYMTFGCLNRFDKVGDAALALWARILAAVPTSRLLLAVVNGDDARTRSAVCDRLAAAGIASARIDLTPRTPDNRYGLYARVDLALDPFPHNGLTTSLDTLYMGVPFVALEGCHTASRMGAAVLRIADLPSLIARDADAYVAIACRLATDADALIRVRTGLRERLVVSPHMDHRRHAREVGAAFDRMWRDWLGTEPA